MAVYGQRAGFTPIEPVNDEIMGLRNLKNSTPMSFDPGAMYRSKFTKEYGSAMDQGKAHMASSLVNDTIASNTGAMDANERYQALAAREDEIKARILEIDTEINYQTKLQKLDMSGDPMWEMAKHDWIYKGDRAGLEGIMTRSEKAADREWQSEENRKNREATKSTNAEEKKQANKEILERRRKVLNRVMSEYAKQDTAEARNAIFEAALDYAEYADKVGEDKNELFNKLLKQYEGQTNNPLRELFGMNTDKAPTATTIGSSGEMVGSDSPAPAPAMASPNIKSESDLETALKSATSLADMDRIANEAINGKVVVGDKANTIKQRILEEKRKEADVKLNDAKTSRALEALVKEYEGILDPVRKTTLDTKIKSMRYAEAKATEAKRKWLAKQDSIMEELKGMGGMDAAEWIEDHNGYDEYVEVLNGVPTRKAYKARYNDDQVL